MSESGDNTEGMRYVPALVIGGEATLKQRARNFAFYQRIRDGVPGDFRQSGLKSFVFEVPLDSCEVGPASSSNGHRSHLSFRLDPESDCYRRLVSYIVGHTDAKCDADDRVEYLTKRINNLLARLTKACDVHDATASTGDLGAARGWFDSLREDIAGIRAEMAQGTPPSPGAPLDPSRCATCGWTLAEEVHGGCVRGNCSMRPRPERLYDAERAAKEAE